MSGDQTVLWVVPLLLFAVLAVLVVRGGIAVVRTTRSVHRRVEERGRQARGVVEEAALRARALARPGAQGRAAALRAELRQALAAARRVLESGVGDDPQLREALGLLGRLEAHARGVDEDLRILEREPMTRAEARLPDLRERAERIVHSANSLRWAAQERRGRWADEELGRLSGEIEAEAGALRHWIPASGSAVPSAGEGADADGGGRPASGGGTAAAAGAGAGAGASAGNGAGRLADALRGLGALTAEQELGARLGAFAARRRRPQSR